MNEYGFGAKLSPTMIQRSSYGGKRILGYNSLIDAYPILYGIM